MCRSCPRSLDILYGIYNDTRGRPTGHTLQPLNSDRPTRTRGESPIFHFHFHFQFPPLRQFATPDRKNRTQPSPSSPERGGVEKTRGANQTLLNRNSYFAFCQYHHNNFPVSKRSHPLFSQAAYSKAIPRAHHHHQQPDRVPRGAKMPKLAREKGLAQDVAASALHPQRDAGRAFLSCGEFGVKKILTLDMGAGQ